MLFLMILSWWLMMFMMTVFTLLTSMSNCLQRKSRARRSSILFTLPLLFRSTLSNTYRKSFVMFDHMKILVYGWICTFFAKPFGSENQFWGRPFEADPFGFEWWWFCTWLVRKNLLGQKRLTWSDIFSFSRTLFTDQPACHRCPVISSGSKSISTNCHLFDVGNDLQKLL